MVKPLSEIAQISTGQTFRTKVGNNPKGEVLAIQIKDLSDDFMRITGEPHRVKESDISKNQLLQKGDILFLAKGRMNTAVLFNLDAPAVAASFFFVIRPNQSIINPAYLAWFINQRETQAVIHRHKEGALVSSIKKSVLEELIVTIPRMKTQNEVAKISSLQHRSEVITRELLELQKTLLESHLLNRLRDKIIHIKEF